MDNDQTNPDQEDTSLENEPEPLPGPDPSVKDYVDKIEPIQAQRKKKKIAAFTIVGILCVIAAVGGVFIVKNAPIEEATQQQQPTQNQPTKPTITSDSASHQSRQFFLDFNYPSNWEVVDEQGSGQLTVTSPQMNLPGLGGTNVSGKAIMTIRKKTAMLPEFDEGNALAVIDSEKIAYERPSQSQRGETYLSFLNFASSASSGGIDGIYITGDFGYKKDQAIPMIDIQKIDPIISVTFVGCDGTCTIPAPITEAAWQDVEFGGPIKQMFRSLRIN